MTNISEEINAYNSESTCTLNMDAIEMIFEKTLEIMRTYITLPEHIKLSHETIRSSKVFGRCVKHNWTYPDGKVIYLEYQIHINKAYINAPCTKEVVFDLVNVLAHEILHTIEFSHSKRFVTLANLFNSKLGFKIETHYSPYKITELLNVKAPKYELRCKCCNKLLGVKYHNCKTIKNIEHYTSKCCNADVKVVLL